MSAVLSIYSLIVLALTKAEYQKSWAWQNWLKPLAAAIFVLIAILGGSLYWGYGQWITWGLIACAIGDVFLLSRNSETKFQLGMAAFAAGHILYIVAFFTLARTSHFNIWGIIPLISGAVFFYWLHPKLPRAMLVPVIIYSCIIVFMVVKSLTLSSLIIAAAAILFSISDMFVARDRFVSQDPRNALAITPLYFGAQALFAVSAGIGGV